MKKITLSPAHSLIVILLICVSTIIITIHEDLKENQQAKLYMESNKEQHVPEDESGGFLMWESLSNRLLTFSK